jgi:O-antigen ligase
MAALMACLALLSQSRGTALAMAGALLLVMALTPERTRRAYALLVIAGGVALAAPDLLHVYDAASGATVSAGVGHAAGRAALLAMLGVGCVWALLVLGWHSVGSGVGRAPALRRAGSRLLVVPVLVALALAVGFAHRLDTEVSRQWHAFVHVGEAGESTAPSSPSTNRSRLLSGAGNRYDYWRIAWQAWTRHPLDGLGAGNYPRTYFQRRSTTEDVEQPHSLELQTLSELGLVGALLLGAFVAGVGWGALRTRRAASRTPLVRALMVGGLGSFTVWLVQASVDWMQLLPGLTGIALAAAVLLVWPRPQPVASPQASRRARLARALADRRALALGASAIVLALIVSGASLSRQGLSDLFRSRAQRELDTNQSAAIADADRSLEIDGDAVQTYYVKAAALARFDQARAAESALTTALAREPQNYVTWTLLGDVAARQGRLRTAQTYYAHAHRLNPLNRTLSQLMLEPREDLR